MTSRRDLLRAVGGAVTAGLAGCAALPTFDRGGGDDERRPFTDWLYAPGSVSKDHYPTVAIDTETVTGRRDSIPATTYGAWRAPVVASDPAEIGMDRIDSHVRFDTGTVVGTGEFSLGELAAGLERAGFTERSEYEGYRVYLRSLSTTNRIYWEGVAAGNGVYVASRKRNRFSATLVMEQAIDAAEGRAPRYDIESSSLGVLVDHLADATVLAVQTFERFGRPTVVPAYVEGTVGAGHGLVVDGDPARRRVALSFGRAPDAGETVVREWARAETPVGEDVPTRDVSLEGEGRTFVLSWEQPLPSVTDRFATAAGRALSRNDWIDEDEATDDDE